MDIQRIAAFSDGDDGGNPAGVVLCDTLPSSADMQSVAAKVGYSETVFAAPFRQGWKTRYFAPEIEVPFCGHATIALGAALARQSGDGIFRLYLGTGEITVEGQSGVYGLHAALQSPPTSSSPAPESLIRDALRLFSYRNDDLDLRLPVTIIAAGARHLLIALLERQLLADMHYDMERGRALMLENTVATICLIYAQTPNIFHARNPFASGGVYEDPATGAAAAALAGYLRELEWPHGGAISIIQGEDMGARSKIHATISEQAYASIRVSGDARIMGFSRSDL